MVAKIAPLIVIVGETASGKSDLAMELAKKFNGEIIAADSRTVYKELDIGTAKASKDDRVEIPHHTIDIVEPNDKFNVAMYKDAAEDAIKKISSKNKLPIMVGGTGLYIDAVIYSYNFDNATKECIRKNTLVVGLKRDKQTLQNRISVRVDEMLKDDKLINEVKNITEKIRKK